MNKDKSTGSNAYDAIVIGSGAAGLTAALKVASSGKSVLVLEKSEFVGGTSAMSGADTWVPANHIAAAQGIQDSPELAYSYFLNSLGDEEAKKFSKHWKVTSENSGPMLEMVMKNSPLDFKLTPAPDPIDVAGAKKYGRNLSPMVLPKKLAYPFHDKIRTSTLPHLFTFQEMFSPNPWVHPFKTAFSMGGKLIYRWLTGRRGQGSALITGLVAGVLKNRGEIRTQQNITSLYVENGKVSGVVLEGGKRVTARLGVLLATGGFEWNEERYSRHFLGPTDWLCTPRSNTGDGLALAEQVGAKLDQLKEANVHPALPTKYEGKWHGMPVPWHVGPHAIIVNSSAQRFVSEYDYNLGAALNAFDEHLAPRNLPAWVICDKRHIFGSLPFSWYAIKAPNWMVKAASASDLAQKINVDPAKLVETINKFNRYCELNRDADFNRGEPLWERFRSGNWQPGEKNKALGGLNDGPLYAMPINRSILGTKGGPLTNEYGQVLSMEGQVIDGLYAAGNVMANPIGTRAVSAGTTIGPHMTMGFTCAKTMLNNTITQNSILTKEKVCE